jgi:CTP:molybdopterin cytidylyltransferase MocA
MLLFSRHHLYPDFASGMYSSIREGVRRIAEGSSCFFLRPVDIPLVRRGTINLLTRSLAVSPARILYPVLPIAAATHCFWQQI